MPPIHHQRKQKHVSFESESLSLWILYLRRAMEECILYTFKVNDWKFTGTKVIRCINDKFVLGRFNFISFFSQHDEIKPILKIIINSWKERQNQRNINAIYFPMNTCAVHVCSSFERWQLIGNEIYRIFLLLLFEIILFLLSFVIFRKNIPLYGSTCSCWWNSDQVKVYSSLPKPFNSFSAWILISGVWIYFFSTKN